MSKTLQLILPDNAVLPPGNVLDLTGGATAPPPVTTTPPPATTTPPPVTTPPPTGSSDPNVVSYTVQPPASGQATPKFNDLLGKTLEVTVLTPASYPFHGLNLDPTHAGFVHFAEVPGGSVVPRTMRVFDATGAMIYEDIGNTAPGVNWTINNTNPRSAGANFNVPIGGWFKVTQEIPNYRPTMNTGTICDVAYPYRY